MTKDEFIEWKSLNATKEVFKAIKERQDALKDELAYSAGVDSVSDSRRVGAIQAYQDLFDINYEGLE